MVSKSFFQRVFLNLLLTSLQREKEKSDCVREIRPSCSIEIVEKFKFKSSENGLKQESQIMYLDLPSGKSSQ